MHTLARILGEIFGFVFTTKFFFYIFIPCFMLGAVFSACVGSGIAKLLW